MREWPPAHPAQLKTVDDLLDATRARFTAKRHARVFAGTVVYEGEVEAMDCLVEMSEAGFTSLDWVALAAFCLGQAGPGLAALGAEHRDLLLASERALSELTVGMWPEREVKG